MLEQDLDKFLDENNLTQEDKEFFKSIITPIINHPEFKKRLDSGIYPHHAKVSLGRHILNDAIEAYKIAKKKQTKYNLNLRLVILIAMFHDLYELPWQNSGLSKKLRNRHGFTHPIEAAINAVTWFPEYFSDQDEAKIILDGIIHHMYPFPVRAITKDFRDIDINNLKKLENLPPNIKEFIIKSSLRYHFLKVSLSRSNSKEGRIVSTADTLVSVKKENKNFNAYKATITGKNPDLLEKRQQRD